jgi:hypothetical protein
MAPLENLRSSVGRVLIDGINNSCFRRNEHTKWTNAVAIYVPRHPEEDAMLRLFVSGKVGHWLLHEESEVSEETLGVTLYQGVKARRQGREMEGRISDAITGYPLENGDWSITIKLEPSHALRIGKACTQS